MKRLVILSFVLNVSACGSFSKIHRANSRPEVKAPDAAEESFLISRSAPNGIDTLEIGIKKTSLDKEFLLQGSLIPQQKVAQFSNMKSRVVAFRVGNGSVFMLEATQGHTVSKDLPQSLVLAAFPVTRVEGDVIYFDFARGMNEVPLVSDWYAEEKRTYKEEYVHGQLAQSYLEDARIVPEKNALVIRQIAQITAPKQLPETKEDEEDEDEETGTPSSVRVKTPVEARYYLTPYRPSEGFEPVSNDDPERYGFFEIAPQFDSEGETVSYVSKFDGKSPIVFALSPNTPAHVREAVRDGVLYWNQAFGRTVTEVIDAPEGRTAPDYEYNIIQWVNWDGAGYAYADAQMDPRTGEILHAQIFLTSAFAVRSKANAEKLVTINDKGPEPIVSLSLGGLGSGRLCERRIDRRLHTALAALISEGADDERVKDAVGDHLREVVAHEVGHALGLRHNFAGSLGASFDYIDRKSLLRSYLEGSLPADFVTTSSVMDYQLFEESVITGRQIRQGVKALAYDASAIAKLYDGKATPPYATPLFCTDDHKEEFVDCKTFDTGRSPLAYRAKNPIEALERLPYSLAKPYVSLKESGLEKDALRKATKSPSELATALYETRAEIAGFFRGDRKVLSVRRSFDYLNALNEDVVRTAEEDYISKNVIEAGGVSSLFAPLTQEAFQKLGNDTIHYVKMEGKLTEEDLAAVQDELTKLMAKLPGELEKEQLKHLTKIEQVRSGTLGDEFSVYLKDEAARLILTEKTGATGRVVTLDDGKTITLPVYAYPQETRHGALKLIAQKKKNPEWAAFERFELKRSIKEHLRKVLSLSASDEVEAGKYPREIARWIVDTQQLIGAL